jgi:D-3-phosphoglycerate dehydrogenase / 2-oxoglutarate reductase
VSEGRVVRALITTVPFGAMDPTPLRLLERAGIEYVINPLGRKLVEEELAGLIGGFQILIAGTEPITDYVMSQAPDLRLISRIGIGLDSVDLLAAQRRNIRVAYTPDAPAPAVAELTLGLMLMLLRSTHLSNAQMHRGQWTRVFGRRLSEVTVGVVGAGRIGSRVIRHLQGFSPKAILVHDLAPPGRVDPSAPVRWVTAETLLQEADVVSLHVPLTGLTRNWIGQHQLRQMKPDAVIINTSRGGIINEQDLHDVLADGHLAGAAVDVFEQEPYAGPLASLERCVLTAHMGSMSVDCRARMEREATEEAVRWAATGVLSNEVPQEEVDAWSLSR